jgi:hypothetical protein
MDNNFLLIPSPFEMGVDLNVDSRVFLPTPRFLPIHVIGLVG